MDDIDRVREQMVRYQADNNLSDQQMAELIGCSRPLYQRTRTSKVPLGGRFIKGALKLLENQPQEKRCSTVRRVTGETNIETTVNLDGTGTWEISTGAAIFDHFLSQIAKHGKFDITIKASGDDIHHIIEDVALCLGKAFNEATGDKRGIERMADVTIPMDETLALAALDFSGRGYSVIEMPLKGNDLMGFPGDMMRHFFETFASEARINLHVKVLRGTNDHHMVEAVFKAMGRALDKATRIDPRISDRLPTTKNYLEN